MRSKSRVYRGIEFISVSELPADQQLLLQHSTEPERIKILVDGKIISNCIQYTLYCEWFTSVFERSVSRKSVTVSESDSVLEKILR